MYFSFLKISLVILLFSSLLIPGVSYSEEKSTDKKTSTTLRVAAIDWCPQICPGAEKKGYVVDLVEAIFADTQYKLDINYYPWSRAIKLVRDGKQDALLSPAKSEAPDLIYPQYPVGVQKMCFFTKMGSDWQYDGQASLAGQMIGIGKDTSVEELNDYVKQNTSQFLIHPYVDRYIKLNASMVLNDRLDSFLFTLNTTKYELTQLGLWQKFRNAGCVNTANIYMPFSPALSQAQHRHLTTLFDSKMQKLKSNGVWQSIVEKYGLL